jgi:hypothetical protein
VWRARDHDHAHRESLPVTEFDHPGCGRLPSNARSHSIAPDRTAPSFILIFEQLPYRTAPLWFITAKKVMASVVKSPNFTFQFRTYTWGSASHARGRLEIIFMPTRYDVSRNKRDARSASTSTEEADAFNRVRDRHSCHGMTVTVSYRSDSRAVRSSGRSIVPVGIALLRLHPLSI